MKIAIAQLNYTIGDVDGNASKIIDSIHKAKAQHADLVIFAEQAVSGTPAFDLLRKTTFLELCEDALVEIASCCDGTAGVFQDPRVFFLVVVGDIGGRHDQRRGADPGSQGAALHRQEIHHGAP